MRNLAKKLTEHVQEKQWDEAKALFAATDENQKNYLLAGVRGPSPEELAKAIEALTPAQLYAALFDPLARENLKKAFLTGLATDNRFMALADMAKLLKVECPFEAEITRALPSVGGPKCPLAEAFNQKDYSDMTIQMGSRSLFAHRDLLSLDPYFKKLLEKAEKDKPLVIPSDDLAQAEFRLRRLYGLLTMDDIVTGTGQRLLREIKLEPLSLAPLYNAGSGDITLVLDEEGQTLKAHRFILVAALPYFKATMNLGGKEVTQKKVDLTEHDPELVKKIIQMVYTGKEPEFATEAERNEFSAKLAYFNPGPT